MSGSDSPSPFDAVDREDVSKPITPGPVSPPFPSPFGMTWVDPFASARANELSPTSSKPFIDESVAPDEIATTEAVPLQNLRRRDTNTAVIIPGAAGLDAPINSGRRATTANISGAGGEMPFARTMRNGSVVAVGPRSFAFESVDPFTGQPDPTRRPSIITLPPPETLPTGVDQKNAPPPWAKPKATFQYFGNPNEKAPAPQAVPSPLGEQRRGSLPVFAFKSTDPRAVSPGTKPRMELGTVSEDDALAVSTARRDSKVEKEGRRPSFFASLRKFSLGGSGKATAADATPSPMARKSVSASSISTESGVTV